MVFLYRIRPIPIKGVLVLKLTIATPNPLQQASGLHEMLVVHECTESQYDAYTKESYESSPKMASDAISRNKLLTRRLDEES